MMPPRPSRSTVLFAVGVFLAGVAVLLALLDRSSWAFGIMLTVGVACMVFPLLHADADEASVEAGHGWVKLWWRKERVQEVEQDLGANPADETSQGDDSAGPGFTLRQYATVDYADINNDGETELIVQYPHGAHSNKMKVFGWVEGRPLPEFSLLAESVSEMGSPYSIGDLDSDGQIEIATIETDRTKPQANHASGPYVELLYRWDGAEFREVGRREIGSPANFDGVRFSWYRYERAVGY
jgi:hypothetical protein